MLQAMPLADVYRLIEPGPVVLLTTTHRGGPNIKTMTRHMTAALSRNGPRGGSSVRLRALVVRCHDAWRPHDNCAKSNARS